MEEQTSWWYGDSKDERPGTLRRKSWSVRNCLWTLKVSSDDATRGLGFPPLRGWGGGACQDPRTAKLGDRDVCFCGPLFFGVIQSFLVDKQNKRGAPLPLLLLLIPFRRGEISRRTQSQLKLAPDQTKAKVSILSTRCLDRRARCAVPGDRIRRVCGCDGF